MLKYDINIQSIQSECEDIIRLFFPEYKRKDKYDYTIKQNISQNDGLIFSNITINYQQDQKVFEENCSFNYPENSLEYLRYLKRFAKNALYKVFVNITGKKMHWGSLTGIRPTRLAYEMLESGCKEFELPKKLKEQFDIADEKIKLITEILESQKGIYIRNPNDINLYINIPVCTSRCSYCSFVSSEVSRCFNLLDTYSDLLCREIKDALNIILEEGRNLRTVYIGGGTPTALNIEQLEKILQAVPRDIMEFSVEAGRADTINAQKLDLLQKYDVTRISINPQTFSQTVLNNIGRAHSVEDFYTAYNLAKLYNFKINTDLIAGLPGDDFESFKSSVDKAAKLLPDNITVHTLSLKRGSALIRTDYKFEGKISDMVDYAYNKLKSHGYMPYYLYRQKSMLENLENTGYSLAGKQCINNIDNMEESISVIACGAGAISKLLCGEGRIERSANVKNIDEYINRFDEMLLRKRKLFV